MLHTSQQLGISTYKPVAEAVSHEVGHAVSVSHDGYLTDAYYFGHGTWAPIMGVGYYRATTQWSRGEYAGATNTQADLQVMQNHIAPIADDHADSAQAATVLATGQTVPGVISSAADNDLFQFAAAAGTAAGSIAPGLLSDVGRVR